MLTTFLPIHADVTRPTAVVGARTAPAPGLRARRGTPSDDLVRSLFGPWAATVEELVARDIAAFTTRRLTRP